MKSLHSRIALERHVRFLTEVHGLKQIILIGHEGCAFYQTVKIKTPTMEEQQYADLVKAMRYIRDFKLSLEVSAYFIRKIKTRVEFDIVPG